MTKFKSKASDPMLDKIILTAQLYYNSHFSQQEIADRLHISRPWVSKLLNKAQEMGFVKITIDTPISGIPSLEEKLKEKYPLPLIRVVKAPDENHNYVALSAANYFVSQIQNGDTIGIGWGNAVSQFIQELVPLNTKNIRVVPMAGSFGATFETLPNYSAIELAKKIEGEVQTLHAPAFCSSQEEYETLTASESVHTILDQANHCDIAVAGIGSLSASFLTRYNILSQEEIGILQKQEAAGDILLRFLNSQGDPVETEWTQHTIRADIFEVKKHARQIISLAWGKEKSQIIHAVLSAGLVDAFFTDEETALDLLERF
ncbi:sugar-binding transcriptional regulator [uncultured Faecalicoccus sp.]|uniref:sugar-binding transcriptional regulator n=1 Tax=uncultured Faecalicoccus sp. TaxID=1971760 RepID=UPI0025EF3FF0|nr:sugar-binding domain-containing protein [uncultured Faecalicoccus sp.]